MVGEYGDGETALTADPRQRPHLLFLDIQMDPLNGIDLARALEPEQLPSLVFVTAYDTYALEAFEVCAVDYLLKPFDQERFRKTLARVRPRHRGGGADERQALLAGTPRAARAQHARDTRGAAAPAGGIQRPACTCIDVPQVEMIEADRNYVAHPRGPRQFPCAQHAEPGRAGAALAADAADQPLVPRQHELRARGQPTLRGDFILVLAGRRDGDQQRGIPRQGQGIPGAACASRRTGGSRA